MKKLLLSSLFVLPLIFDAQQKFSIIPSVGYAWRTAKTVDGLSAEEKDYVKKLKSGLNFDISAYYHLKPEIGIGLKFSSFSSSSSGTIIINEYTDEAKIKSLFLDRLLCIATLVWLLNINYTMI